MHRKILAIITLLCLLVSLSAFSGCQKGVVPIDESQSSVKPAAPHAELVLLLKKDTGGDAVTFAAIVAEQDGNSLSAATDGSGIYRLAVEKKKSVEIKASAKGYLDIEFVVSAEEITGDRMYLTKTMIREQAALCEIDIAVTDSGTGKQLQECAVTAVQDGKILACHRAGSARVVMARKGSPVNLLAEGEGYRSETLVVSGGDTNGDTLDKEIALHADSASQVRFEVSKLADNAAGRRFIEVAGKPFPMLGIQIRLDGLMNCDKITLQDFEKYIEKAKELNVSCVEIPIEWADFEPEQDTYDFTIIDALMTYMNKYGLKLEILWFGQNMCGGARSYYVPRYILSDPVLYPRFAFNGEGSFGAFSGENYMLQPDSEGLLLRESKALTMLMDHVYSWNRLNGEMNPVISVQVENEADSFPASEVTNEEKNVRFRDTGNPLSQEEAWRMIYKMYDVLGNAVKVGNYKVLTRVNLAGAEKSNEIYRAVNALSGIDMVGIDPYIIEPTWVAKELIRLDENTPGNYPHIAENRGMWPEIAGQVLTSTALGYGFNIYDLASPAVFANSGNSDDIYNILNYEDLSDKTHTPTVRKLLYGLKSAGPFLQTCALENFAAFNVMTSMPQANKRQTIKTTRVTIGFTGSGLAFAIDTGDCVLAFSTEEATMDFSFAVPQDGTYGCYDRSGNWFTDGNASPVGGRLTLQAGKLYRIPYLANGTQDSTTRDYLI